jgi:multidrug resistance efflux pump
MVRSGCRLRRSVRLARDPWPDFRRKAMTQRTMHAPRRRHWIWALALAALGGCDGAQEQITKPARSVTVATLAREIPRREVKLTGTVGAWNREKVAFEVAGRVDWIGQEGDDVRGRVLDEDGRVVAHGQGQVIARLRKTKYENAVAIADKQREAAAKLVEVARIQTLMVAPEDIKVAEAQAKLAEIEYGRARTLFDKKTIAKSELDQRQAEVDSARASLAKARANLKLTEGRLAVAEAQLKQADVSLSQANEELADCQLHAPFTGRINKTLVTGGAVVSAGQAIVELIMMDPVYIDVTLSAAHYRAVEIADRVRVTPPGGGAPIDAFILVKGVAADPATRTFQVRAYTRNRDSSGPTTRPTPDGGPLPKIDDVAPVVSPMPGLEGPLLAEVRTLHDDENGTYCWKTGVNMGAQPRRSADGIFSEARFCTLSKVYVTLGAERMNLVSYNFRSLVDTGGLAIGDLLVSRSRGVLRPGRAEFVSQRWLFQPGDMVDVRLELGRAPEGLYVPLFCIIQRGDKRFIYLVGPEGAGAKSGRAERHEVRVAGTFRDRCRVEAADPADKKIKPGARYIIKGAHYVVDGQRVDIRTDLGQ